jgi:peptidyl-prolyl cis-trans isomerase C
MKVVPLIVLVLLVLSACDREPSVAKVGDKNISQKQFDAYLKFKRLQSNQDAKKKEILAEYLDREALALAVEKAEVLDNDLINAELNEFRKEMLISRYFEKYLNEKVSDQAIQNYYTANKSKYDIRKVHVAHILLRTNRTMSETERLAKQTTIQAAYSALKAGTPFEEVAKDYSEDAISAKKGGDLGWLSEGAIDKRFSDQVFSMEPGTISEPFETPFGFHVVKLIEGPVATTRPLEAVKGDIRYQLRNEAKAAEIERLKAQITIQPK